MILWSLWQVNPVGIFEEYIVIIAPLGSSHTFVHYRVKQDRASFQSSAKKQKQKRTGKLVYTFQVKTKK